MTPDLHEIFHWVRNLPLEIADSVIDGDHNEITAKVTQYFRDRYGLEENYDQCVATSGVEIYAAACAQLILLGCPTDQMTKHAAATIANYAFAAGCEYAVRHTHEMHDRQAREVATAAEELLREEQ